MLLEGRGHGMCFSRIFQHVCWRAECTAEVHKYTLLFSLSLFYYFSSSIFFLYMVLQILGLYESYFCNLICNCGISLMLWRLHIPLHFQYILTISHPYPYVNFLINLWFLNIDLIVETKREKAAKMNSFQLVLEFKIYNVGCAPSSATNLLSDLRLFI